MERRGLGGVSGETQLMIMPGYRFALCDGLITNFHQVGLTELASHSRMANLARRIDAPIHILASTPSLIVGMSRVFRLPPPPLFFPPLSPSM